MLQLEFSEADKRALNHERYHHPHPRVQQRMEALWLKSQGLPHQRIATLCAISGNTLRAYLKLYQAGGMEALKQLNFYRPQSLLSEQRETIEAHLRAHPPHTVNEAISVIEALTGIRRSPTQIRVFLKHLGLKCLKVGLLPAKGDPEEPEGYQKKVRAPLERKPGRGSVRSFLWMRRILSSARFSVTCGVSPGAGSRRPVGGSASVSWARSMRSPTT